MYLRYDEKKKGKMVVPMWNVVVHVSVGDIY
jgi:hypothetical protein